jgi:hypothetical protein
MAQTNDSIAYAYAISSKTQKLSVQPNIRQQWSGLSTVKCNIMKYSE